MTTNETLRNVKEYVRGEMEVMDSTVKWAVDGCTKGEYGRDWWLNWALDRIDETYERCLAVNIFANIYEGKISTEDRENIMEDARSYKYAMREKLINELG